MSCTSIDYTLLVSQERTVLLSCTSIDYTLLVSQGRTILVASAAVDLSSVEHLPASAEIAAQGYSSEIENGWLCKCAKAELANDIG